MGICEMDWERENVGMGDGVEDGYGGEVGGRGDVEEVGGSGDVESDDDEEVVWSSKVIAGVGEMDK